MARIPGYVAEYKENNETARYENGEWYLYFRKSQRFPGEKYPRNIYVPVAIVRPSGRISLDNVIRPSVGDYICYEIGYSYVLKTMIDPRWKASLGEDWEPVFYDLIRKQSPTSYLLKDRTEIVLPEHRFVDIRQERFWNFLPSGLNERIQTLKQIQISYHPDNKCVISRPTDAQARILSDLNITLEGCVLQ